MGNLNLKKIIIAVLLIGVVGVLALQLVPVSRTNPPVLAEPAWDSPETRALAKRACFDCHSNESVWPWYAYVAPVSWLIVDDVMEGRENMNFSEWTPDQNQRNEAIEQLESGRMPLPKYLPLHPEARLTDAEKEALIKGFQATFNNTTGSNPATPTGTADASETEDNDEDDD